MIGTPIAFGLTMIVCFTLFYYYWRIRQLRARLLSVQSAPAHDDFPVEFGIGKNVVETFPTIKACELKCTASEDSQGTSSNGRDMMTPDSPKRVTTLLRLSVNTISGLSGVTKCPICLVEYEEWEVLRQLPFCGHIFHTLCVGAWFEKQTTCPVCRMSMSELTESFGNALGIEDILYRGPRSSDAAVEMVPETPSWIMINRRLPLPAPPIRETPTESAHTCTCSSGHGTETTQPKTGCERVQLHAGSTDFHVVNIQQVSHTCSKCKCTAKPAKTSDESLYLTGIPATHHQHSDVQILIFQTSVLARTEEGSDPPRLDVSEGVSNNPQETSGSIELATTQPILEAAEDDSNARDCTPCSGEAQAPEDVQTVLESPQGSFEFSQFSRKQVS